MFLIKRLSYLVFLTVALSSFAGTGAEYVNGVEGIKAASVPPPGLYSRNYVVFYSADTLRGPDGGKVPVGFDADVSAVVSRLLYITKYKFLGADYGFDVTVPLIRTSLGIDALSLDETRAGLGDIIIEPVILSWHFKQADLSAAAGLYFKTGNFAAGHPASPGKDYGTTMFTLGGTLYLDRSRKTTFSILGRYETHGTDGSTGISPGNDFHFEFGIGHTFGRFTDVGIAGYAAWQVSADSGAVTGPDVRDRIMALGPEISTVLPKAGLMISVRVLKEFNAVDRPEGWIAVTTLTHRF
ncbi:MAG: transporter [Acidobacteria bacterium]|nr:transporter [Acidobacteriota bacterium]